jgi:hypothetical protein
MQIAQSWRKTLPMTWRISFRKFCFLSSLSSASADLFLLQNVGSTAATLSTVSLDNADLPPFLSSYRFASSRLVWRRKNSIQRLSLALPVCRIRSRRALLSTSERDGCEWDEHCWEERETKAFSHSEAGRWGQKSSVESRIAAQGVTSTSLRQRGWRRGEVGDVAGWNADDFEFSGRRKRRARTKNAFALSRSNSNTERERQGTLLRRLVTTLSSSSSQSFDSSSALLLFSHGPSQNCRLPPFFFLLHLLAYHSITTPLCRHPLETFLHLDLLPSIHLERLSRQPSKTCRHRFFHLATRQRFFSLHHFPRSPPPHSASTSSNQILPVSNSPSRSTSRSPQVSLDSSRTRRSPRSSRRRRSYRTPARYWLTTGMGERPRSAGLPDFEGRFGVRFVGGGGPETVETGGPRASSGGEAA